MRVSVLSYGAGVQTTALAAMSALGVYEKPDFAVFADPGWETKGTYEALEFYKRFLKEHGIKLYTTSKGNIRDDALSPQTRFASIPYFTETGQLLPSGRNEAGRLKRQCTAEYKIYAVVKKIREVLGYKRMQPMKHIVDDWLGISLDETQRMKDSRIKWLRNKYPLVEMRKTRGDCIEFLKEANLPIPPKSSCIGCPFHSNSHWRNVKENLPEEWEDACDFDDRIRHSVLRDARNKVYIHRSLVPLREADLQEDQMDLFGSECEGYCGL